MRNILQTDPNTIVYKITQAPFSSSSFSRSAVIAFHRTHFRRSLSLIMCLKRKLEVDDDVFPVAKQLKLIPFPNMDLDTDVAMSDAVPLLPDILHSRLSSNASSVTYYDSESPLSPTSTLPSLGSSPPFDATNHSPVNNQIGLLQPMGSFIHHGSNCTQIPKLRVACASGINGQRSMWTHCEQCGAISIVESD